MFIVKQVSTTKSFGIVIDQNLMWHGQIDKITQKIASGIGAMHRTNLTTQTTIHLQCLDTTLSDKRQL